ncbi:hypothetical protein GCK72_010253 [Caenorhabditis remanei]|uniref:KID domain-containing protein n=1 Tax=Caenorhabditis remanei TaxID=31234 RepID=A0A6A5H646_CAERE|nr:hypothetical protein GCK72_010253 [Caenorhabditis remanei]KAF1761993.1 hypothetical protein GCK72_010253 [Caenorhabditis remanei]
MTSTSNCSQAAGSPLMMLLFKVPNSNTAMQEGGDSEDEARRRREQLNRRPSYRRGGRDGSFGVVPAAVKSSYG